uniref:Uncharacterized protein n=1 Tax=Setaria italica TaxID=4555 RepID=K3XNP3_SETIT
MEGKAMQKLLLWQVRYARVAVIHVAPLRVAAPYSKCSHQLTEPNIPKPNKSHCSVRIIQMSMVDPKQSGSESGELETNTCKHAEKWRRTYHT